MNGSTRAQGGEGQAPTGSLPCLQVAYRRSLCLACLSYITISLLPRARLYATAYGKGQLPHPIDF